MERNIQFLDMCLSWLHVCILDTCARAEQPECIATSVQPIGLLVYKLSGPYRLSIRLSIQVGL
eukprot:jgi/Botrbrau1/6512/Bobra.0034s0085.1